MKKYQLATVSSPSMEFEVGGHVVESTVILNTLKNPNFDEPLFFFDVVSLIGHYPSRFRLYIICYFGNPGSGGPEAMRGIRNQGRKPESRGRNLGFRQRDLESGEKYLKSRERENESIVCRAESRDLESRGRIENIDRGMCDPRREIRDPGSGYTSSG